MTPTTRETADHAELAVAWRVKDFADGWIVCGSEQTAIDLAVAMSGATIQPLFGPALLSEIAALRGENERLALLTDGARLAALEIRADQADALRKALERQCDNMSFVLNRVELHAWADRFSREVAEDRALLANQGAE